MMHIVVKDRIKNFVIKAGPALIITTGALFLFWPILSGKHIFPLQFIGAYHYGYLKVMRFFFYDLGILPNWWPAFNSGYPIALTLDGFLNPLFLATIGFLNPFTANNLLILFFFLANAGSFYFLARNLGLSKPASLVGTLAYSFSGVSIKYLDVTGIAALMPFLPLSFLICKKIMEGRRRWFWLWLPLMLYVWVGGWSEMAVYALVATGSFTLYLLFSGGATKKKLKNLLLLLGGVIMSIVILLPWFLSILNFISYSARSGGISNAAMMPITLSHFLRMIHPNSFVYYGETMPFLALGDQDIVLYIGTLPFLLVLVSIFTYRKNKGVFRFFFWLGVMFLLIAIKYSPLFWLLHQLPVLNWFGGQWKWSFVIVFSLSLTAAHSLDYIKIFFRAKRSAVLLKILWGVLITITITSVVVTIYQQSITTALTEYGVEHFKNTPDRVFLRSDIYYKGLVKNIATSVVSKFSFTEPQTIFIFTLWIVTILFLTLGKYGLISWQKWLWGSIFITFLGSIVVWKDILKGPPVEFIKNPPATARFLHATESYRSNSLPLTQYTAQAIQPYRIFLYTPDQYVAEIAEKYNTDIVNPNNKQWFYYEMMDDNLNVLYDLDAFYNHQALALRRMINLYYTARQQSVETKQDFTLTTPFTAYIKNFSEKGTTILGMLNVKYVLSPFELTGKWKKIFTTHILDGKVPIYIYQNPDFMPRWYFAKEIIWTESDEKLALDVIKTVDDFNETTLLERKKDDVLPVQYGKGDKNDSLKLLNYTAGRLRVETVTKNARFVVFSENKYPFWRASINGKETNLYTANYLYQAVLVPAGKNLIEFSYPSLLEQGRISAKKLLNNKQVENPYWVEN
ncbi:MAG: hypothetical protein Q8R29_01265 [bacterium]|nr:hypothetical protein [bacterium]